MKKLARATLTAAIVIAGVLPITAVSPAVAAESSGVTAAPEAPAATCGSPSWTPSTGVIAASCTGPGAMLFHVQCANPQYDRSSGWLIVPTAGRTMTHLFPVCNGTSRVTVSTRTLDELGL